MRPHAVFRLVATIALAAASQPMPDTFCFDHGGAPTGREIAGPGGTRAALLPYREIVESFGKKVTPLASLSVDANGDGRVPAACYEAGEIGLKAPYGLKLAPCGVEDHLELLSICLALCDREPDCDAAHVHKIGAKDECRLYSGVSDACREFPLRLDCSSTMLKRKGGEAAGILCPEAPWDASKYAPVTADTDFAKTPAPPPVYRVGGVVVLEDVSGAGACREDGLAAPVAAAIRAAFPPPAAPRDHSAAYAAAECGTEPDGTEPAGSKKFFEVVYWIHALDGEAAAAAIDAQATDPTWLKAAVEDLGYGFFSASESTWTKEKFRESELREWPTCVDGEGNPTGFKANPWQSFAVLYDVQMLPEDHPTPEPFLKSMVRPGVDFYPIPDGCFSDTTFDGTPDNPALVRKGKHYEFLGAGCLGDRTNEEMVRICMTACLHLDFGGPGTRDRRCWGINYDEHGYLGHCHLVGPTSSGSQMTPSCANQVQSLGGDPSVGLGACVAPQHATPRVSCQDGFLNTDDCGMPNQLALACHVPDVSAEKGFVPAFDCAPGYLWDGVDKRCEPARAGTYTLPQPSPDRYDDVPRPLDCPGFLNAEAPCPKGRVCPEGTGCAFDADPALCPGFCPDSAVTSLLPDNPGGEGSSSCAQLCNDLADGVNWVKTAKDPEVGVFLQSNYWRETGDENWHRKKSGCIDTDRPWDRCLTLDVCTGGDGQGDELCRPRHKGPYCEVCEGGSFKALDGKCVRCGSRAAAWISALCLVAVFVALMLAFLLMLASVRGASSKAAHAGDGDEEAALVGGDDVDAQTTASSVLSPGAGGGPQDAEGGDGAASPAERMLNDRVTSDGTTASVDRPSNAAAPPPEPMSPLSPLRTNASRHSTGSRLSSRLSERITRLSYKSLQSSYRRFDDSELMLGVMRFMGNARSVINFLQIVAKVNVIYNLTWPSKMARLMTVVDISTLNFFAIVPFGCLANMSWDYLDSLILLLSVMTGVNLFFMIWYALIPRLASTEMAPTYRRNTAAIWIIFNFLFYAYAVGSTFTAYPTTNSPSGDRSFLTVDMSIGGDSTRYKIGVGLASTVGLVFYVVGIPFMMLYLVWKAKKDYDGESMDRLAILHLVYKKQWWFTEAIVCLEKCTIAGVLVFVKDSVRQAALGLAVAGFWLFFFASAHPFRTRHDNIIKDLCCLCLILVMLGVIMLKIKTESDDRDFTNYSQEMVDTALILVVLAPVAALVGPWLYRLGRRLYAKIERACATEKKPAAPVSDPGFSQPRPRRTSRPKFSAPPEVSKTDENGAARTDSQRGKLRAEALARQAEAGA